MLFTVSHVVRTLTAYVHFGLSYVQNVPFTLDASTKMGAPLLHCSTNDTLISRISHCQNMFTKLINVFDLTFVQVYNSLL